MKTAISQNDAEALQSLYGLRGRTDVLRFLGAHPFLAPLLLEAYDKIQEHFPEASTSVEVFVAPEAENAPELVAFIGVDSPPEEALCRLDRFDEDWWLQASSRAQGKLCIHLEYQ